MDYRRLAILLLGFVAIALAATKNEPTTSYDDRYKAVTIMRIIGTAEHNYFGTAQHYGSLSELKAAGSLKEAESMFSVHDLDTPSGFAVRVIPSDDKKSYQVSVTRDMKPFDVGFFSDERGPIYEGHPLQ